MPVLDSVSPNAHYLLFRPHTVGNPATLSPSLNMWALSVVWTINSHTATLSFDLLIAWSSFALLGRGSLISILDWLQPWQAFHLIGCFCLKWVLMASLPTTRQSVILTALPLQHSVRDLPSMLRYMYIGCLVVMDLCIYSLHLMVLLIFNKEYKFYDSRDFTGIFESQFYLIQFS